MIKQTKKINAKTKEITHTMPKMILFCLNAKIPFSKGKNNNAINPIAALIPCTFEAAVTMSLFSFTWNIPETNPAPTANVPSENNSKTDRIGKSFFVVKKYAAAANARKHPSHINHVL